MTAVLKVVRLRPQDTPLPSYATAGSVGLDVASDMDVVIPPLGRARVRTGIAVEVQEGFEVQVRPRSGLAAKYGVTVLNAPGTIDQDFRGEVEVILVNLGEAPYEVRRGDRIAQLVVAPVARAQVILADSLEETARGSGGFGHTG